MNFRVLRGYSTEGRNNIQAALALPGLPEIARSHALYVGGALATRRGDHAAAMTMLTECLALRRRLGDPREIAGTLSTLSVAHLQHGDATKARECAEESLKTFREIGEQLGEALGLLHLGEICIQLDDDAKAQDHFEECLAIARNIKHQELECECECSLGEIALRQGDLQRAQSRFAHSLKVCRDAADKRNEAIALWCMAKADTVGSDHDSARKKLTAALDAFRALEMRAEALDCLEDCAGLLHAIGESDRAIRLQAAVAAVRATLALPRSQRREAKQQETIDSAQAALGEMAFKTAWSHGSAWTLDEAIDFALASTVVPAVAA